MIKLDFGPKFVQNYAQQIATSNRITKQLGQKLNGKNSEKLRA